MTTVQITLPDQLAQDAQRAGLLSQPAMERLLREKLQTQRMDEFFAASERMVQVTEPPAMSPTQRAQLYCLDDIYRLIGLSEEVPVI